MRAFSAAVVIVALALISLSTAGTAKQAAPTQRQGAGRTIEGVTFSPDASLLFLTPEQQRVAYRNLQLLAPTNRVEKGAMVSPLPRTQVEVPAFTYAFNGKTRSIDDFFTDTNVAGLLVIKRGRIVVERYALGHGPTSAWTSFSVAKSILSLLYGTALQDGTLRSLDDAVTRYLPALRGSAYDEVTLRQLLQMSSGVAWNEEETDPGSDLARSGRVGRTEGLDGVLAYMKRLPRRAPAGTVFNYNTGETHIAGAVLRVATGRTLADYLSEKIWRPAGMSADAFWLLMRDKDAEFAGCCLSATLHDYGRLGLLALRGGVTHDGRRLMPADWMQASTTPAPTAKNYGYLWWLGPNGQYAASGIFGQYLHVAPKDDLVVAIHSLWPVPINKELPAHQRTFIEALTRALAVM